MKITLFEFLELMSYSINEGGRYLWKCYGDNAWYWDYWGKDVIDFDTGFSIVFDKLTQEVYEVSCYALEDSYVYRNSNYKDAYDQECLDRKVIIDPIEVSYDEMMKMISDAVQN